MNSADDIDTHPQELFNAAIGSKKAQKNSNKIMQHQIVSDEIIKSARGTKIGNKANKKQSELIKANKETINLKAIN